MAKNNPAINDLVLIVSVDVGLGVDLQKTVIMVKQFHSRWPETIVKYVSYYRDISYCAVSNE